MTQQDYNKATSIISSINKLRNSKQRIESHQKIAAAFDEQISELEHEFEKLGTESLIDFHNKVIGLTGHKYSTIKVETDFEGKETFSAWNEKNWFYGTSQQEVLDKIKQAQQQIQPTQTIPDESHDSTTDSPQDTLPF